MNRHRKYDEKRRSLARIPGSRLTPEKASIMDAFYSALNELDRKLTKADMIVWGAAYALRNRTEFVNFINEGGNPKS